MSRRYISTKEKQSMVNQKLKDFVRDKIKWCRHESYWLFMNVLAVLSYPVIGSLIAAIAAYFLGAIFIERWWINLILAIVAFVVHLLCNAIFWSRGDEPYIDANGRFHQ